MDFDFRKFTSVIGVLLVLTAVFALGQGIVTGSISGAIQDPQRAVVAGAQVTAKNLDTGQVAKSVSNDQGYFSIRNLPAGNYTMVVEAPGFRRMQVASVTVNTGVNNDLGIVPLEVGATTETVTVEGAAPLVETNSAQGGQTFTASDTQNLPLNGGFDQLVLFTPGVVTTGNAGLFANSNGAGFGANGQRDRSNTFQIDGQFNNDTVVTGPAIFFGNQDALQEVQVVSNNFGVEYGRTSGATVNYVTKSGGNNFHGSGFEYYTGNWADSLTYREQIVNGGDGKVPRYVENRWGGTFGGPIVQNKIFFFAAFMQDTVKGSASPATSSLLTPIPGPTGLGALQTCYPNNAAIQALTAIGPFSIAQGSPVVNGTPKTLSLGGGTTGLAPCTAEFAGVSRTLPSTFNDYEAVGRADFTLNAKDQLFFRYVFTQPVFVPNPNGAGQFGVPAEEGWTNTITRNQQGALDWTRNWSSHLVNQIRFSYVREVSVFQQGGYPKCLAANLGACPTFYALANGLLSFGQGVNVPSAALTNNSQWQDNASLVHGRHTLKFGGEYDRQRAPNIFLPFVNGRYTFKFAGGSTLAASQNTFNQLLLANPSSVNLTAGNATIPFKEQDADLYFGDDWRIKDNLTLNLGVRWEFNQQAINLLAAETIQRQQDPKTRFWDPTLPLSVTAVPQVPNHYKHFAPSVGFAWTPHMFRGLFGENKTVIRGGFRMAYDPAFYNIFLNVATAAPAVNAGAFSCAAPCPLVLTGADAQTLLGPSIPKGVNPGVRTTTRVSNNFTNPYAEEWTLGIQREISNRMAAEVRYVGSHTVHEFQTVNGNPVLCYNDGTNPCTGGLIGNGFSNFIPSGITPCANPAAPGFGPNNAQGGVEGFQGATFANCDFTLFRLRDNGATGKYHSLQTQLRMRSWHGFTAVASYTFSKNIDNASEIYSTYGPSAIAGPQNPFCTGVCEKGLSALDFPHNFTLFWQYELPFGKGQSSALSRVLGGWALGATYKYTSGQVWSPFQDPGFNTSCNDDFSNNYFGASACRPFAGSPAAPVTAVGQCTDATLPGCGLVDLATGLPTTASAVRWIVNDDTAAKFFGTPYGNVRRNPGVRGDAVNTVNLNLIKNTRVSERVNLKLEANVYNLLNHLFLGVPAADYTGDGSCFGNTRALQGGSACNDSGGVNFDSGSGPANPVGSGLAQRRIVLGAHIVF